MMLIALEWMGDKKMDIFLDKFDMIVDHMQDTQLSVDALRDVLYDKLTVSHRLADDLRCFNRDKENQKKS